MANFCRNCGTDLGGAAFCPKCGTPAEVAAPAPEMPAPAPAVAPVAPAPVAPAPVAPMQAAPVAPAGKTDGFAIAGFVCGIIGALCCTYIAIPGLICSILSLVNIKKGKVNGKLKWMAITGIVLSAIGLALMVINIITMIAGTNATYNEIMNMYE